MLLGGRCDVRELLSLSALDQGTPAVGGARVLPQMHRPVAAGLAHVPVPLAQPASGRSSSRHDRRGPPPGGRLTSEGFRERGGRVRLAAFRFTPSATGGVEDDRIAAQSMKLRSAPIEHDAWSPRACSVSAARQRAGRRRARRWWRRRGGERRGGARVRSLCGHAGCQCVAGGHLSPGVTC